MRIIDTLRVFLGSGTFLSGSTMSVSSAAEPLRYRQTEIESVGPKANIPHASVHRFTNIVIIESRRFMSKADLPIYRGVPLCFSIIVAV